MYDQKYTYTIKASTYQLPDIVVTQKHLSLDMVKRISRILVKGFKDVCVTIDQTGEVVFSQYRAEPYYRAEFTPGECICEMERILDNGDDYYGDED